MKAAVFHGVDDIRLEDVPMPTIRDDEVLVRIFACAICGSDVRIFHNGHKLITPPMITGHEMAGEVVEVGNQVDGWKPGDRFTVATSVPCLNCRACERGYFNVCEDLTGVGFNFPGGFAEYTIIPQQVLRAGNLLKLPDALGYREGAISEPLACVVNGQELSKVGKDDVVTVIGAGPIGCMHIALAKQRGAKQVISVGISAPRIEQARKAGADVCIDAEATDAVAAVKDATGGWGADCVIVAAGSLKAQEDGIRMAARRGRVNLFGGVPKTAGALPLDSNFVHYDEVFVHGSYGSTSRQHAHALELMASGKIDPGLFISQVLPFDRILDGFAIAEQGNSLKVVLDVVK